MRRMYSLAQIQAIVALMASKGELDFSDVDLKVKTVEQSQPNFSANLSFSSNFFQVTNIYNKFIVINGVAYVICSTKLTNNTEESATAYFIASSGLNVSTAIAEKLIDADGDNATVSKELRCIIASHDVQVFDGYTGLAPTPTGGTNVSLNLTNETGTNNLAVIISGQITIPAGETRLLMSRMPLTLF